MRWLAALVLLGVAVAAHLTTPTYAEQTGPFVVSAGQGEWGQGRTLGARVDDVALADEVTDGDWVGTTPGVWVVVTVTAEAALDPGALSASLWLDEVRYDVSDRPGSSALNAAVLAPGLPEAGDLLFEVPAAAVADHGDEARLRLARSTNPRLDSVVDVPLELGDLTAVPAYELAVVERASR